MARQVHILALGARTPLGLSAERTAAAVRGGIGRFVAHPLLVDGTGQNVVMSLDSLLPPDEVGWMRLCSLAATALTEVTSKLESVTNGRPLPILLALPESRPGFADSDVDTVLVGLRARLPTGTQHRLRCTGRGHAGGLLALSEAVELLASGSDDLAIAGGVDSYAHSATIDWLLSNRQLTSDEVRSGFTPGEGAGFVVLVTDRLVNSLRLPTHAVVRSVGTARETALLKTDAINLGNGLATAVTKATQSLRDERQQTGTVYCDINGERYRSEEWGFAILRIQDVLSDLSYIAPAECWGDVGAASGPLFVSLAVEAWKRKYASDSRALLWAGSESGVRTAALLERSQG